MRFSPRRGEISALLLLSGLLGLFAGLSLSWDLCEDSPVMAYLAYAVDRFQLTPYRDLFDMNLPGTYGLYLLLGRCGGYTDLGYHCGDLIILGVLLAGTAYWMRPFGRRTAWLAALLFGFFYLGSGPAVSMEREYLILLPLLAALIFLTFFRLGPGWRAAAVGLCLGMAALIKPQALLVVPLLAAFLLWMDTAPGAGPRLPGIARVAGALAAGTVAPLAVAAVWLLSSGAWPGFRDMVVDYWPLYNALTGSGEVVLGVARLKYLAAGTVQFGGLHVWLASAALGLYLVLYRTTAAPAQKRQALLLAGLAAVCALLPAVAGKFWPYHWLPCAYFLLLLSSLCLSGPLRAARRGERIYPKLALVAVMALGLRPPPGFLAWVQGEGLGTQRHRLAREVAADLKTRLQPGDRVQPLDWTEGAVHAMLLAGAPPATPFLYDFHFYHHADSPCIQGLRQQFMDGLAAAPPRFIIRTTRRDTVLSGARAAGHFPALDEFLGRHYAPAAEGSGYVIFERQEALAGEFSRLGSRPF
ncbi:MAG: hypothetical protein C4524_09990 [Candidatus Zixiibacteriota bacterium]|nr:MAG: hypothetical protein C4524_09990 [candidate division Zixibacteria bacterium]